MYQNLLVETWSNILLTSFKISKMRKVTPILLKKDIQIAYEESKFWM